MARTATHKYIHNDGDIAELYDLEADPGEFHNLAGQSRAAAVERQMRQRLLAWYDPAKNPHRPRA
jgi:hypothetical protein